MKAAGIAMDAINTLGEGNIGGALGGLFTGTMNAAKEITLQRLW